MEPFLHTLPLSSVHSRMVSLMDGYLPPIRKIKREGADASIHRGIGCKTRRKIRIQKNTIEVAMIPLKRRHHFPIDALIAIEVAMRPPKRRHHIPIDGSVGQCSIRLIDSVQCGTGDRTPGSTDSGGTKPDPSDEVSVEINHRGGGVPMGEDRGSISLQRPKWKHLRSIEVNHRGSTRYRGGTR